MSDPQQERESEARRAGCQPSLDSCIVKAIARVRELAMAQIRQHGDYYGAFPPTSQERDDLAAAFEAAIFADYAEDGAQS